jgi:hypothetical protein
MLKTVEEQLRGLKLRHLVHGRWPTLNRFRLSQLHAADQTKRAPRTVVISQETNHLALLVRNSVVINANDIS